MLRTATSVKVGVAVALAACAMAGCGGSDDEPQQKAETVPAGTTIPQAASQAATTAEEKKEAEKKEAALAKEVAAKDAPERAWAKKLCSAMTDAAKPLAPPNLSDSAGVETTQRSLVRFFSQARQQLGVQLETLEEVGAPPNGRASTEWQQATGGLETIRGQLRVVERSVKSAKLENKKDLEKFTADLGQQMEILSSYPGPIAILSPNPEIGPALQAEPGCQKLS